MPQGIIITWRWAQRWPQSPPTAFSSRVSNQNTGGQITRKPESGQVEWSAPSGAFVGQFSSSATLFAYKTCDESKGGRENAFLMEPQQLPGRLRCCSWFLAPCSAEKYAKKLSTLVIFICVPASCFGATRRMRNAKANALSPATHAKK